LFRLVSLGDLLHLKGFELGLRAFAQFQKQFPQSEYWLMGEGPERQRLQKIARTLGVEKSVKFWGRIPRAEVLEKLADCDVLVHPSLHDSGGWVCLEAMAAGRPVICLDIGGPGLQVTAETGVKVKAISPKQAIDEMAAAMAQLAKNPELKNRMGEAGRVRVREIFAWEKKGEWLRDLSLRIERVDSRSVLAEGIENAR
jgi:glycosyltransferase involved in cell wall biosynthesis